MGVLSACRAWEEDGGGGGGGGGRGSVHGALKMLADRRAQSTPDLGFRGFRL